MGERWSDDRLDDLAHQVRTVSSMTSQLATHDAKIDGLVESLARVQATVVGLREESREQARASAWTPMVRAAVLGPTMASLVAAVALILTKGH